MVGSPDRDTDFFDTVTRVLQGGALVPFMFIICLDYVIQTLIDFMKYNCPTQKQQN